MKKMTTKKITMLAIMLALVVAVEVLENSFFKMPQGGSLSVASLLFMLFTVYLSFAEASLLFILWRILVLIIGNPFIVSPLQFLLEYFVAYSGFLFTYALVHTQKIIPTSIASVIANTLRYLIHVVAGVVYFGEYATGPVWQYSAGYNLSYMLPTLIVQIVLIVIMVPALKKMKLTI